MDKAGHEPDTDHHLVVSLPLSRLRGMKPFALLVKLRILQPLHHQLDVPRVHGHTKYASRIKAASVNNISCLLLAESSAGEGGYHRQGLHIPTSNSPLTRNYPSRYSPY